MSCTSPQCYLIPFGSGKPVKSMEDYPSGVYPGLGRVVYLPCGGCLSCRRERRQELTLLQCCEASLYVDNWFITLTYDDKKQIERLGYVPFQLNKFDIQDFLESLRKGLKYKGIEARYFGCGEYGDSYHRPHYHLSLFGVPASVLGIADDTIFCDMRKDTLSALGKIRSFVPASRDSNGNYYWQSSFIACRWKHGNHMIYRATRETFQYVAGYVVKKMTGKKADPSICPEFQFQSRPSIGYPWFLKYCDSISLPDGDRLINDCLQIAGKSWKIPRIFGRWLDRLDHVDGPLIREKLAKLRSAAFPSVPDRKKLKRKADYEIYRDRVNSVLLTNQKKGLNPDE